MKSLIGKIVSDKTPKMAVVEVERFVAHPIYHKRIRKTKKFHAVNEMGAKTGALVKISEIKPISKTKNWKVLEIVAKEEA